MKGNNRGFTLVEVMAALAILAIGLTMIMRTTANTVRRTEKNRMLSVAVLLARGKMLDVEEALRKDGFQQMSEVGLPENEGTFEDEGWPNVRWEVEIREIELPTAEQLAAMSEQQAQAEAAAAAGATDPNAAPTSDGSSSGLFGMISMFGGTPTDGDAAATGQFMGGGGFNIVQEVFKAAIRKVVLTVKWRSFGVEDSFKVVQYITDPDAMNRVIGSGTGGATADVYEGNPASGNNNNTNTNNTTRNGRTPTRGGLGGGK